jgi:hypothetical protein
MSARWHPGSVWEWRCHDTRRPARDVGTVNIRAFRRRRDRRIGAAARVIGWPACERTWPQPCGRSAAWRSSRACPLRRSWRPSSSRTWRRSLSVGRWQPRLPTRRRRKHDPRQGGRPMPGYGSVARPDELVGCQRCGRRNRYPWAWCWREPHTVGSTVTSSDWLVAATDRGRGLGDDADLGIRLRKSHPGGGNRFLQAAPALAASAVRTSRMPLLLVVWPWHTQMPDQCHQSGCGGWAVLCLVVMRAA